MNPTVQLVAAALAKTRPSTLGAVMDLPDDYRQWMTTVKALAKALSSTPGFDKQTFLKAAHFH